MTGSSPTVLIQETATENLSLNSGLRHSYHQAKKNLQEGMNVIKEEFLEIYDRAGDYIYKMVLPVNNFLKDLTQIDAEFRQELDKELPHLVPSGGTANIIPIEQALAGIMEENY